MENIIKQIKILFDDKYLRSIIILIATIVIAKIIQLVYTKVFTKLVKKTKTKLDDEIVSAFQKPVFWTIVFIGLIIVTKNLLIKDSFEFVITGVFKTLITLLWIISFFKTISIFLKWLGKSHGQYKFIQKKTIPLFDNTLKLLVLGGGFYFVLLIWKINVTALMASAGIAGLAIGFAAKDTLANFFSGIFIMVDSPYKIGDYIDLGAGERGKVTMIGLRSTRILTLDNIEIIIPNAVIGNAKIINESGGPTEKFRIHVNVGVAYGSDIDRVKKILMEIGKSNSNVCDQPQHTVRFMEFGDSSLNFQFLCWLEQPAIKCQVIDQLNTEIYKKFIKHEIEIPFPQIDLNFKNKMPEK